jgi:hypothetical protein
MASLLLRFVVGVALGAVVALVVKDAIFDGNATTALAPSPPDARRRRG